MPETGRAVYLTYIRDGELRRGSGLHIGANLVLTADHCASGADHHVVTDAKKYAASVLVRSGTADVDLAILQVHGLRPRAALPCALIDRTRADRVTGCRALGYPSWKKDPSGEAALAEAPGAVPTVEGLNPHACDDTVPLMSLKISDPAIASRHVLEGDLDKSEWAGMSGAVVLTDNDTIIGVIRSHAQAEGVGSLGFTPLDAINTLSGELAQKFWSALSVGNQRALSLLPQNAEEGWDEPLVGALPGIPDEFVDRDVIRELSSIMDESPAAVVCTVTGMRGVGKTQLARAYAQQALDARYDLVGWIDGRTPETIEAGLADVAERVHRADPGGDSAKSVKRLREYFVSTRKRFLLVFDNATDPDHFKLWLKKIGPLKILITTTNSAFAQQGAKLEVGPYSREESVAFLESRTKLSDPVGADHLADALGDLPLAIAVSAATIQERECGYEQYLERLSQQTVEAWLTRIAGDEYPLTVWKALCLSLDETEAGGDATTYALLGLMAVLAPDGVRRDLLVSLAAEEKAPPYVVDDAIDRCRRRSVIITSGDRSTLRMHGLMRRVVRERAEAAGQLTTLATYANDLIRGHLFDELEAWQRRAIGNQLIAHIDAFWATGIVEKCDRDIAADALAHRNWATRQLIGARDSVRAGAYATAVVADADRMLDRDHRVTLEAHHNLANALVANNLLQRAIEVHAENLANYESALGPDDLATMRSRDSLANTCMKNKAFDKAISLHTKNLRLRERVHGPEHRDTLASRTGLSVTHRQSGRKDVVREMVPMYQADLEDRSRILGASHPDTLESAVSLAYLYSLVGRLEDSINLYTLTLARAEIKLGSDHPTTMEIQRALAGVYRDSGQIADAIRLNEAEVAIAEELLGPDHPDSIRSRRELADNYRREGREDVLPLFEKAVADSERILGPDHPETLDAKTDLAYAYRTAGRAADSIQLLESTLADYERTTGLESSATLDCRNQLAVAYDETKRLRDAINLYESNLEDRVRILGTDHPDTLQSRRNLANAYLKIRRFGEAIMLYEVVVADSERSLPDATGTLGARGALASAYLDSGQLAIAVDRFGSLVADRIRVQGADHRDTLASRHNLAACTGLAGDPRSAVRQFHDLVTDHTRLHGPDHDDTVRARNRLVRWLSEDPEIVVWLELLVAAHLVGRPSPSPDRPWLTKLVSRYPRDLVATAVERRVRAAVDARHPNIAATFQPAPLAAHLIERATGFLTGRGIVCDGEEKQWHTPDYLEYTDILSRSIRALRPDDDPSKEFLGATEWLNLTTTWPVIAFNLQTMR